MTAIGRSPEFRRRKCLVATLKADSPRSRQAEEKLSIAAEESPAGRRSGCRRPEGLCAAQKRGALGVHQTDEQHRNGDGGQAQNREQGDEPPQRIGAGQHDRLPANLDPITLQNGWQTPRSEPAAVSGHDLSWGGIKSEIYWAIDGNEDLEQTRLAPQRHGPARRWPPRSWASRHLGADGLAWRASGWQGRGDGKRQGLVGCPTTTVRKAVSKSSALKGFCRMTAAFFLGIGGMA
jgi:hypothetical protein